MDLIRWPIIIAMILVVFIPSLHAQQKHKKMVVQKHKATRRLPTLLNTRVRQVAPMPHQRNPALIKMLYQGKHPAGSRKRGSSTVHRNKSERLLHPIIIRAAKRYKVDSALVKAIIMVESSFDHKATSKKGARGLMQLMPKTAKLLGVKDIFNPEQNINGGVKHFKSLLKQFKGDVTLALAAYNAGSKKVRKYKGVPPFKATKYYIKKVFEYYRYYGEN
jgi:soluble lytic murein transglycosylase-like protein